MKRTVLLVVLAASFAFAKDDYVSGTLLDFHREHTGAGALRAQGSFCLAIEVNDVGYVVQHAATWRWSYEPTDLIVGDKVDVKIKGNSLYLQTPGGKELKTSITRRERVGKEHPSCGTAVTFN